MRVKRTARGFELIKFTDIYDASCSLQQSSLACQSALWFGPDKADPKILASQTPAGGEGWVSYPLPDGVVCNTRAHLSVAHVRKLVKHMQAWLSTGSLRTEKQTVNTGNPELLDEMEAFAVACNRAGNGRDARQVWSWIKRLQAGAKGTQGEGGKA